MEHKFSKLDLNKLKFSTCVCDLCGSSTSEKKLSVSFLNYEFQFVKCLECGLIYQNPSLERESLNHIYDSLDYWDHKNSDHTGIDMLNYYSYFSENAIRLKTAELRLKMLEVNLNKNSRILDLGTSEGLFLHVAKKRGYKHVYGMDISQPMIEYGKKTYDVDIVNADFEGTWPFETSFDVITCFTTANILQPSRVFANIRSNLKIGGYFYFTFCDAERLVSRILGSRLYAYRPTATTVYSRKTIDLYCKNNGLKIIKIWNDIQIAPIARIAGFVKMPVLSKILKRLNLDNASIKLALPTQYAACAKKIE